MRTRAAYWLAGLLIASGEPVKAQNQMSVEMRDGRVVVHVADAPLADIVRLLGERTGFRTVVVGDLDVRVSSGFSERSVKDAVLRLSSDVPTVMFFEPSADGSVPHRLAEVRLYAVSDKAITAGPRPAARGPLGDAVLDGLLSEDAAVRVRTVAQLEREGGPQNVELLADLAEADPDATVRARAIDALGRMGTEEALFTLEASLMDEEQNVRLHALHALGRMGTPEALQIIGESLLEAQEAPLRDAAIGILEGQDSDLARALLDAAREESAARR